MKKLLTALAFSTALLVAPSQAADGLDAVRSAYIAVWLATPLAVHNVTLTEGEATGMGAYKPAADNSFTPGEAINIYAEVTSYHWRENADGSFTTLLGADLTLKQKDGTLVASQPGFLKSEITTARQNIEQFFVFTVKLSEFEPGDYDLGFVVSDQVSGEKTSFDVPVTLVAAP